MKKELETNAKKRKIIFLFFIIFVLAVCTLILSLSFLFGKTANKSAEPTPVPTTCPHFWENGKCILCGEICTHPSWANGSCVICGTVCPHSQFVNGTCPVCGYVCTHPSHNSETLQCSVCGTLTYHNYVGGVCSCGKQPNTITSTLPDSILSPCSEQGTVETVVYTVPNYYVDPEEKIEKEMSVYLPYGYTAENKYNVLVLFHGGGGTELDWTTTTLYIANTTTECRNIYDNMIQQRLCRPLIIVSVSTIYNEEGIEIDAEFPQMARELKEEVLPTVIENYSTYASGTSEEEIIAARDHFGIGGLSNGSLYAMSSGLERNLSLFSNFVCMSGSATATECASYINVSSNDTYPIRCLFMAAGSWDEQRRNTKYGFDYLVKHCTKCTEDQNAWYVEVNGGHEWTTWTTGIYDALQILFPEVQG